MVISLLIVQWHCINDWDKIYTLIAFFYGFFGFLISAINPENVNYFALIWAIEMLMENFNFFNKVIRIEIEVHMNTLMCSLLNNLRICFNSNSFNFKINFLILVIKNLSQGLKFNLKD